MQKSGWRGRQPLRPWRARSPSTEWLQLRGSICRHTLEFFKDVGRFGSITVAAADRCESNCDAPDLSSSRRRKSHLPAICVQRTGREHAGFAPRRSRRASLTRPIAPFPSIEHEGWSINTIVAPARRIRALAVGELARGPPVAPAEVVPIIHMDLWVMLHRARMVLRRCLETNWFGKQNGAA